MNIKYRLNASFLNLFKKIYESKKAESLSPLEIKKLQQRRLTRLLKYVVNNSEFYRDFYLSHGIDIKNLEKVKFCDLPMIDKEIMMKNFDKLVCDKSLRKDDLEKFINDSSTVGKKYKGVFEVVHTSGSSGHMGIFVYGPDEWNTIKSIVITRVSKPQIKFLKKSRLAFLGAVDGHYAGVSLKREAPKMLFNFLSLDINSPISEIVEELNCYKPDNLSGYSSGIYLLALEQLRGRLDISPKRIVCSADPLTSNMRKEIFNAFNVSPINFYAATESIGMASECDGKEKALHLFDDLHIFEVVDKSDCLLENGPGNLVVTSLYNYTQPLIRYKMDDEVIVDGTHNCSWPFPVLSTLCGREEEVLWFKGRGGEDVFLHPLVFIELRIDGLEKLQVIEITKNHLKFNVLLRGMKENIIDKLKEEINSVLDIKDLKEFVEYEIVSVSEIPNDPRTGKFRGVITNEKR